MSFLLPLGFVVIALTLLFIVSRKAQHREETAKRTLADISELGDNLVPTSIHPLVDPARCIGSGTCVQACPEPEVIALISGKMAVVNPLACVGHGACAAACPMGAIELVFGTAKRGVELPILSETFETSQPGIYVVGELGGIGLIRNAIRQGMEVGMYIHESRRRASTSEGFDVTVVGAGPAGISATLELKRRGLKVLLLEADTYGGTIAHYPRAKVTMTGPLELPGRKKRRGATMTKEELLELWNSLRTEEDLPVREGQMVHSIHQVEDEWEVETITDRFRSANVVLAVGRRGAPRKLGVPGEELEKVNYRLLEPEPFANKRVLVVGGGNAAAECAISLAEAGICSKVELSYRRKTFARLRKQVLERFVQLVESGHICVHVLTQVERIAPDAVILRTHDGEVVTLPNDAVIVQVGGTPPSDLLDKFGIQTVEKRAEA